MKRILSLCVAAVLLLSLVGCGQGKNPPSSQGSQEQGSAQTSQEPSSGQTSQAPSSAQTSQAPSEEDACQDLIEGGICIREFEQNLRDLGYNTFIEPLPHDESIKSIGAYIGTDLGHVEMYCFYCYIRDDGEFLGAYFNQIVPPEEKDTFAEVFSQQVDKYYADICTAAPAVADTFLKEYVPVPEKYFEQFHENKDADYECGLPGDDAYFEYVIVDEFVRFTYSVTRY